MPDTVIDPRAIDVRVAREVYRKEVRFLVGFEDEEMEVSSGGQMGWYEIEDNDGRRTIGRMVPHYSRDIAIARDILDDFPISVESDGTGKYRFLRRSNAQAREPTPGEWEGDMAMAICHGALEYAKAQRLAEE